MILESHYEQLLELILGKNSLTKSFDPSVTSRYPVPMRNLNQFEIRGKKFEFYAERVLICWLEDGRQYIVKPFGKGYLALFVNGYTSETLERITWHKLQYCALAHCSAHAEEGGPERFARTGAQEWKEVAQ